MTSFDPTRASPGRLARLGVVIPPTLPDPVALARLCDRAGIEIVWVGEVGPAAAEPPPDLEALARDIHERLGLARVGVMGPSGGTAMPVAERTFPAGSVGLSEARRWRVDVEAGRSGAQGTPNCRLGVAIDSMDELRPLLSVVDDIVLTAWRWPDLETAADEARAEAAEAGRDPASLGVAAVIPVSIGRTEAEAAVRADADPGFRLLGHPRDIGIFGTLEACQDRVIALAHAGIADLRCILPAAPDVHDVIAQLTAATVGTTEMLVPGSLRSPAPPPPEGWGGRPDRPPRQGVSDGSRRR